MTNFCTAKQLRTLFALTASMCIAERPASAEPLQAQSVREPSSPRTVETDFWGGVGFLGGESTYQIGNNEWADNYYYRHRDTISELKFPIAAFVGTAGGSVKIAEKLELHGQFTKSITDFSGKLEDSDYSDPFDSSAKTVYSESDTDFDSWSIDAGARYWLPLTHDTDSRSFQFSIAPGVGVIYQRNHWSGHNLDQWYPQNPSLGHITYSGTVIDYKTETTMPYVGASFKAVKDKFDLSATIDFAYAMVSDRDEHILRNKSIYSDQNGAGGKLTLRASYDFTKNFYTFIQEEVLGFYVTGTQHQILNTTGQRLSIDSRIFSVQSMVSAGIGIKF